MHRASRFLEAIVFMRELRFQIAALPPKHTFMFLFQTPVGSTILVEWIPLFEKRGFHSRTQAQVEALSEMK